jgi:hypothetical protein
MSDLRLTVDDVTLTASWVDENESLRTALAAALPVAGDATRWGDELYFDAGLDADPTTTAERVPVGAVAYWPAGDALCLFWGPTPASTGDEPRAAAPVALLATIDDVTPLDTVSGGAHVTVERA